MIFGSMRSSVCYRRGDMMTTPLWKQSDGHSRENQLAWLCDLGQRKTISNLLQKFDSIYGTVDVRESVLAQFYSARQQQDETVSDWSCRLEDLLAKAVELGRVHPLEADEMLRCMFWTGLKKELKDVSGHKFDRISTFDELRVAIH